MQIKLKQLIETTPAVRELLNQPLPAATAFRLSRVGKSIESELASYEEARKALCERCGKVSADGSRYDITDRETFDKEMSELQDAPVELNAEPLPLAALGNDARISPASLMALDWLITE